MASDLNTLILNTIKTQSKYGLEIIDEIKKKTNGTIVLKQPSLYSALRRLEAKGLVSSFWKDSELGGKRHYYQATQAGIKTLDSNLKKQDATKEYLNSFEENNDNDYDEQISSYNYSKQSKSNFTQSMKQYVTPNNNYDNFPQIDEPFSHPDALLDEEDLKDEGSIKDKDEDSDINYKNILGDFLDYEDENTDEDEPQKPVFSVQPSYDNKKAQNKSETKTESKYVQEFETLFKSNKKSSDTSTNPDFDKKNLDMLESLAKKYNERHAEDAKNTKENIETTLVNKIKQKKNLDIKKIEREEDKKYLYINKINFVSSLCLFFINIVSYSAIFLLCTLNEWINQECYIILGSALFCSIYMFLASTIIYKKYPDKKIGYKFKWIRSFLVRLIIFVALCVLILAVNLVVGMETLSELTTVKYLIRWLVPAIFVFNIILRWIINLTLSRIKSFQIKKPKKIKTDR